MATFDDAKRSEQGTDLEWWKVPSFKRQYNLICSSANNEENQIS